MLKLALSLTYVVTSPTPSRIDRDRLREQGPVSVVLSHVQRLALATLPGALHVHLGTCCAGEPSFWHTQRDVCQKVGPPAQPLPLPD